MRSVRAPSAGARRVLHRSPCRSALVRRPAGGPSGPEPPMLDIVYVLAAILCFAVVALIARAVEKL